MALNGRASGSVLMQEFSTLIRRIRPLRIKVLRNGQNLIRSGNAGPMIAETPVRAPSVEPPSKLCTLPVLQESSWASSPRVHDAGSSPCRVSPRVSPRERVAEPPQVSVELPISASLAPTTRNAVRGGIRARVLSSERRRSGRSSSPILSAGTYPNSSLALDQEVDAKLKREMEAANLQIFKYRKELQSARANVAKEAQSLLPQASFRHPHSPKPSIRFRGDSGEAVRLRLGCSEPVKSYLNQSPCRSPRSPRVGAPSGHSPSRTNKAAFQSPAFAQVTGSARPLSALSLHCSSNATSDLAFDPEETYDTPDSEYGLPDPTDCPILNPSAHISAAVTVN